MIIRHTDGVYVLAAGDEVRITGGDGYWLLVVTSSTGREVVLARSLNRADVEAALTRILGTGGQVYEVADVREYSEQEVAG